MRMELDQITLEEIRGLIEANFTGRDELYAAAESLDDERRSEVCRHLAKHLAGHAIELQQILVTRGIEPVGPLDTDALAHALFDLIKVSRGDHGILDAAARTEHDLKESYDHAIEALPDSNAEGVLRRQREAVEFGEHVLRSITDANGGKGVGEGEAR